MKVSFNPNFATNKFVVMGRKAGKTSKKQSVDEVVTDESLNKIRQIAYRDAQRGKRCSAEYVTYLHECREKVAPDRMKIFAEAESKINKEFEKNPERSKTLWDYLLEHLGEPNDDCTVKGKYNADGWVNMTAYDENGEVIGTYDSRTGWTAEWSSAENSCMNLMCAEYDIAYREFRQSMKNGSAVTFENNSKLNITV